MKLNRRIQGLTLLAAIAALLVGSSPASATMLNPGSVVSNLSNPNTFGTNATGVSGVGYHILAVTGWESSSTVEGTGMMREIVVQGDANNKAGGLDFIYQLYNTSPANSQVYLSAVNAFNYKGFATDVSAVAVAAHTSFASYFGASGVSGTPTNAARSYGAGSQVSFNFGYGNGLGTLAPGQYSDMLIIRTNAKSFGKGVMDFNDGGTSGQLFAYQPSPEPTSLALLGGCLAGLGSTRVWRRWRKALPS